MHLLQPFLAPFRHEAHIATGYNGGKARRMPTTTKEHVQCPKAGVRSLKSVQRQAGSCRWMESISRSVVCRQQLKPASKAKMAAVEQEAADVVAIMLLLLEQWES